MKLDLMSDVPIYRQIGDGIRGEILCGRYRPGDRIPPVRELALALRINPNTVARAYRELQENGVLESRPGGGNFVAAAAEGELEERREAALRAELERLFERTDRLGITRERVRNAVNHWPEQPEEARK